MKSKVLFAAFGVLLMASCQPDCEVCYQITTKSKAGVITVDSFLLGDICEDELDSLNETILLDTLGDESVTTHFWCD